MQCASVPESAATRRSEAVTPTDVIYPDTDGEPMAENTIQYRYLTMIKGGLEVVFKDRDDIFVAGDLFWYPVEGAPEIRTAPDVMVAVGRPKGERSSYLQWEEGGIAPQVVIEILSPGNRAGDIITKFLFYQRYGVQEYYTYNPHLGDLDGWLCRDAELQKIPEMQEWVSPLLGVRFSMAGTDLRVFGPNGRPFLTYEELAERAERLAARLRELGVDPDA
jgi:Uma2 family endonuclease